VMGVTSETSDEVIVPRRSVLYMPGANDKALEKAKTLPCDAIIFDTEDSVAPDMKEAAREKVAAAVQSGEYGRRELTIRINGLDTPWCHGDVVEIVTGARDALDVIIVPKARTARDVWWFDVLLTQLGPVTDAVIRRLRNMQIRYALIVADPAEALALSDRGYEVMVGPPDDPTTYEAARATDAAMVVAAQSDAANTNVVFTVKELDPAIPTVATASSESAVEILYRAGCDTVVQLGELLGQAMSRRILGRDARCAVVGSFGDLVVAEANAADTPLVGKTVRDAALRSRCQVNIAGIWQRGKLELPTPDSVIESTDVLILVGSEAQLSAYDAMFGLDEPKPSHVIVVGGGRVGRAAARALLAEGIGCRIVEVRPDRIRDPDL